MSKSTYLFMNHVGNGIDPHDCWDSNGFSPNKVDSNIEDLCVWACELFFSYCWSGQLLETVANQSGRLLPEVLKGLRILDCKQTVQAVESIVSKFGDDFPRNDFTRRQLCESIGELEFREIYERLYSSWEKDGCESKTQSYANEYCLRFRLFA
jgi:hypothetical protein